MMPTDFNEANIQLPGNIPAPAFAAIDPADGLPYVVVAWQPSVEDKAAIAIGSPVLMRIKTTALPVITLYTLDENGNPNV